MRVYGERWLSETTDWNRIPFGPTNAPTTFQEAMANNIQTIAMTLLKVKNELQWI